MATRKTKENSSDKKIEAFSSSSSSRAATTIEQPRKRYMGVRQSPSGRWVAEIKGTAQKIRQWLGTFDTAEEAARAYDEAACLLRGANTRTNFWPRSSGWPGGSDSTSSMLPAKVFNHLLRHLETQQAAHARTSSPPPPSMPLPSVLQPPPPQQQQFNNQSEIEPINRIAYGELLSDVSVSSTTQSGEENEFSMTYCNTESICTHDEQKVKDDEVDKSVNFSDMHLRLEEELSGFYAPFEISMVMEEARRKAEMGTYEYWLMISSAEKNV
ncbi:hypothetical protein IEQ34_004163 [Dendrobium chrysotoxum]|uniref:AP2/ERF domain-containing protein n=1 Tax=Dendrobium chrysotoxum TaxID=161865 RepID=A0AAV7HHJ9_DENCH|nr:hypothetical protein IEQ34_004163 [Dendrobium chrysotoxum]